MRLRSRVKDMASWKHVVIVNNLENLQQVTDAFSEKDNKLVLTSDIFK